MDIIVILIIIGLVLYAETRVYGKYGLSGITYRVYLSKTEAYEGDELEIIEEVVNRKLLPVPWLKSEIFTSRFLEFSGTSANVAANTRFAPSVFALRPYQKCVRKWRVKCLKRGVFRLDDTSIVASDIFGFVNSSAKIKVSDCVTVLPRPADISEARYSDRILFGENAARRFICPDPFAISGTREYSGNEPANRIHWGSSARQNRPMVYNNEFTTESSVLIAVNMQKREGGKTVPAFSGDIELFIKMTAFILEKCAERGVRAGFFINGGDSDNPEGFTDIRSCSYGEILRGLAAIDEGVCRIDFVNAIRLTDLSPYTDIAVITPYLSEKISDFLLGTGKNIVFYSNDAADYGGSYEVLPYGRSV